MITMNITVGNTTFTAKMYDKVQDLQQQINAHRRVSPLEGLRAALGDEHVSYALGCFNLKVM